MNFLLFPIDRGLPVDPYCDEVKTGNGTTTRCTSARDSVALCNLVHYDREIPPEYQVGSQKFEIFSNLNFDTVSD